jgi:hypothetical protein
MLPLAKAGVNCMENACLTASAAKPFRAHAFTTQFTRQHQQPIVLNEKEKEERFRLLKPRLETRFPSLRFVQAGDAPRGPIAALLPGPRESARL